MNIVEIRTSIDKQLAEDIQRIFLEVFDSETEPDFLSRVNEKKNLLVTLAYQENELIGFKLGYEKHRGTFYSWLGGVVPKYQRKGIARTLLRHQHKSCSLSGYSEIQTHSQGNNSGMLILNMQEGFSVFGTHLGHKDEIAVQLRISI